MKPNKIHELSFTMKIIDLKLIDFNALSDLPDNYKDTGIDKDKIQFEFNVGMNVGPIKKRIRISLNVNFFADVEKKTLLGSLNSLGDFEVIDLDEIIKKFDGKIPNIILANLIGVVLSTSRGFFILKSSGTIMENTMLPIINTNVFFPQVPEVFPKKDKK
jgi:hypothetical protein